MNTNPEQQSGFDAAMAAQLHAQQVQEQLNQEALFEHNGQAAQDTQKRASLANFGAYFDKQTGAWQYEANAAAELSRTGPVSVSGHVKVGTPSGRSTFIRYVIVDQLFLGCNN